MRLFIYSFVAIFLVFHVSVYAQISIFPVGGQRGTSVEVELIGKDLKGWHGVQLGCSQLKASIRLEQETVEEEVNGEKKEKELSRFFLNFDIPADVDPAIHDFQLIGDTGLSGRLTFQVNAERNILEQEKPHDRPGHAQFIELPVIVNGRVVEDGEVDYYAFEAGEGERLLFEVITASGLIRENSHKPLFNNPTLTIYEPSGSWFDPQRAMRLAASDHSMAYNLLFEATTIGSYKVLLPRITHRFEKSGWYLVRVGNTQDRGDPENAYQLRVVQLKDADHVDGSEWTARKLLHDRVMVWEERAFPGAFPAGWIDMLEARSLGIHIPASLPDSLSTIRESEPNDDISRAEEIRCASLIEGAIDQPGDVDCYRFHADRGQKLAFEIRTPHNRPPDFHPWLTILDGQGEILIVNFYRRVSNGSPVWVKYPQPKSLYTFEDEGDYYLKIRDLTSRAGGDKFEYQVVVRPQVPHLGKIAAVTINEFGQLNRRDPLSGINIKAGHTEKINIISEWEEGFAGEVAFSFEGLPEGVVARPASAKQLDVKVSGNVFEKLGAVNKPNFRPYRQVDTMALTAGKDAASTESHQVRLVALPVVNSQVGSPFYVQDIPMMVVE